MCAQHGPASNAYQVASETHQSVMVLLAKLFGLLLMAGFGMTFMMIVGYNRAAWAGVFVPVAVVGMVVTILCRFK